MQTTTTQQPDGTQIFTADTTFEFERGGTISPLVLAYETHGTLNNAGDNVILIHHALSTNSHIHSHALNPNKGWWENMIGPGCPIDTERYFVICINNLGSCFGSSGPADNPDFPVFTMRDIVRSQKLLLGHLGIERCYAMIGNSMGAMLSLTWAIEYPEMLQHLISISSAYKAYPANLANRAIQREVVKLDPDKGFKIARKLGHYTYRNPEALNQKFKDDHKRSPDEPSEVENYFEYNASKFVANFDSQSFLGILTAMDLYDVTQNHPDAKTAFSRIQANVLVVEVDSDILFTPNQQQELYQQLQTAGVKSQFIQHHSPYGHDAFLVDIDAFGDYIRSFIA